MGSSSGELGGIAPAHDGTLLREDIKRKVVNGSLKIVKTRVFVER
jgi:hypothetical protein